MKKSGYSLCGEYPFFVLYWVDVEVDLSGVVGALGGDALDFVVDYLFGVLDVGVCFDFD